MMFTAKPLFGIGKFNECSPDEAERHLGAQLPRFHFIPSGLRLRQP